MIIHVELSCGFSRFNITRISTIHTWIDAVLFSLVASYCSPFNIYANFNGIFDSYVRRENDVSLNDINCYNKVLIQVKQQNGSFQRNFLSAFQIKSLFMKNYQE